MPLKTLAQIASTAKANATKAAKRAALLAAKKKKAPARAQTQPEHENAKEVEERGAPRTREPWFMGQKRGMREYEEYEGKKEGSSLAHVRCVQETWRVVTYSKKDVIAIAKNTYNFMNLSRLS
ncbi:hypothetical protein MBM_09655 [Drepanopeziza brunnea f. sp. 'multigermtubi' MB_m1]|uniref:Uncharacterized protein n=1 Tax=Marssonina brunnea f. sp. multigermtubi (strain MB_m1) TaxID=1072389 RepID=K1WH95_MARBU|nr:uncharacterized protein MBM_09655 [Drepanopeziza brunnea f. sp. 'multigermtubi' MB_m1]EKD12156.1 hypothetical protein MBM_09655 [Drepanopeziza brunnea f. sp. 'multigermtubi' MB_m1]